MDQTCFIIVSNSYSSLLTMVSEIAVGLSILILQVWDWHRVQGTCPGPGNGYTTLDQRYYYKTHTVRKKFKEAVAECALDNAWLAMAKTEKEYNDIIPHLSKDTF